MMINTMLVYNTGNRIALWHPLYLYCCTSRNPPTHSLRTMTSSFDPTHEIARAIGEEKWEDVLASRPASPTRAQSEKGWELNVALSMDFRDITRIAKPNTNITKSKISSRFCHVCGRKTDRIRVAPCGRVKDGLCRKVVCEKCCKKMGIAGETPLGLEPDRNWKCPHCSGTCIPSAQCGTYRRTNFKRHQALIRRRREKHRK